MPVNVVSDSSVPGGLKATQVVKTSSLADLRAKLELVFGGVAGNAVIIVNPSEQGSGAIGNCTYGRGHACLLLHSGGEVNLFALNVSPAPETDPTRFATLPPPAPGILTPLGLMAVHVELTQYQQGSTTIIDPNSIGARLALILPDRDDVRLTMKLDSSRVYVGDRASRTGVWLPVELTVEQPAIHYHECTDEKWTLGDDLCAKALSKAQALGGCDQVYVRLLLERFDIWLGFVPLPGMCSVLPSGNYPWMANTLYGIDYEQPCVNVLPAVTLGMDIGDFDHGGDLSVDVQPDGCDPFPTIACSTIVDCEHKATQGTIRVIKEVEMPKIVGMVQDRLLPYISPTDNGAAYAVPPPAPQPCGLPTTNGPNDPNLECLTDLLADSLYRIAYGWFANPFTNLDHPDRRFRITQVSAVNECESTQLKPRVLLQDPVGPARCVHPTCLVDLWYCDILSDPVYSHLDIEYAVDRDGDGVSDIDDNCADFYNPLQVPDGDGDGLGNECDPCPCDETNSDPDGDGVCSTECYGPGDNCPTVANKFQENCNLEAEVAREARILGDACDPVPCPLFSPMYTLKSSTKSDSEAWLTQEIDHLHVMPIGSHHVQTGAAVVAPVPNTAYRFCIQNQFFTNVNCFNDKAVINDFLISHSTPESQLWVWHPVRVDNLPVGQPDGLISYGAAPFDRVWHYLDDYKAWHDSSWGASWVPDISAVKNGQNKVFSSDGRFWIHAEGDFGMTDFTTLGTGMHPMQDDPAQPADSLANDYQKITPYAKLTVKISKTKLIGILRECYWCGGALKPETECQNCGLEVMPEFPSPVSRVIARADDGRVGVISTTGALIPLRTEIGSHLGLALSLPLLWVDQAEPSAYLGKSRTAPIAVALEPESGSLVEKMYEAGGQLLSSTDLLRPGYAPSGMASLASSSPGAPSRTGFVPVYSRSLGRVYLVGGADATGSAAPGVVWSTIDDAPWHALETGPGFVLGSALAATYHADDGKLWILDEVAAPSGTHRARLTRVDPLGGASETLGDWPRRGIFNRYWLRSDRDGSMLLVASSDKANSHAIVRLTASSGKLEAKGFRIRANAISKPPAVDMAGYWLLLEHGKDKRSVERLDELPLLAVGWFDQWSQCL